MTHIGEIVGDIMDGLDAWFRYEKEDEMHLVLPLPPSLNEMIALAKLRDRKRKSTIYSHSKEVYGVKCDIWSRDAGIFPPRSPWKEWKLSAAVFYVHNPRDPIELLAGLKWPVDWLVKREFVLNDSPRELKAIPYPEQHVDRKNQRIEIILEAA